MSFWAGLASGMKDGLAKQERQDERNQTRDWQQKMFDYKQKQDDYVRQRNERMDTLALEERDYNRARQQEELKLTRIQTFLPYLNNPAMADVLAGQGDSASLKPMSPKAIAAGSTAFSSHLEDLTPEQRQDPFFDALSQSRDGQAAVIAFMAAQAKEGNTIEMKDLPKYFRYMGSVGGQGTDAAKDFLSSMVEGSADITNSDTFIQGMMAMSRWKPTQHLFQQIDSPTETSDLKPQYEAWKTAMINEAMNVASVSPDSERSKAILDAVTDTQNADSETRGLNALVQEFGFGADLVKQQGFDDNFLISSFYDQTAPAPEAPIQPDQEQQFTNWEEVEAARQEGFSGLVTIDGQSYNIAPLNAKTPAPDKEQGFVEFGDSATDGISSAIQEINSLDFEANPEMAMNSAKEKLISVGIMWPTNEQELDYFIQDMNEAVQGFGLNIPQQVLDMLIDQAAKNSIR